MLKYFLFIMENTGNNTLETLRNKMRKFSSCIISHENIRTFVIVLFFMIPTK